MSYAINPLIYEKFKGIREYNGVNANGEISAIKCNNVELVQTEIGSNTGIKSMGGNYTAYDFGEVYKIIGIFKSNQGGIDYKFIYAENAEKGTLFYINLEDRPELIIDNLSVTGECNGITMSSTAFDVFIFTNGKEVRTVAFTSDEAYINSVSTLYAFSDGENTIYTKKLTKIDKLFYANREEYKGEDFTINEDKVYYQETELSRKEELDLYNLVTLNNYIQITTIKATDYEGKDLCWLSMTEWNGFLVVASKYGVASSHQNDIYKWDDDPKDVADSWYINFSKKVTAVFAFTGGLYIFTESDCSLLNTTPNDTVNSKMITSAGVGCYSYNSIVKHDIYLFFYDDNQKNIYYLTATDTTGQIKPTGPLAKEIQSYFANIQKFKMYSCIYENKNQIWCLINDNILIYDYAQNEWITRQEQPINTFALINNTIFTGDDNGKIYSENVNEDFSGRYYASVYQTTYINAGSNSNLKKQKTPLLLTLNANYTNDFYVQLTINNKPKNPKHVKLYRNSTGVFANEDGSSTDIRTKFAKEDDTGGGAKFSPENTYKKTVVEISTPQTWYTMGIKIFTKSLGQGFYINSMELKNIKMKTKTKGR